MQLRVVALKNGVWPSYTLNPTPESCGAHVPANISKSEGSANRSLHPIPSPIYFLLLRPQVAAGDQVQFIPQTVEQAYLARVDTNQKVALMRQRAAGLLLDDAAVLKAFQVC